MLNPGPGDNSRSAEEVPNGRDNRVDFFYGKIDEENQDDDGTDRLESIKLELKQEVGITTARGWHTSPLFSRRIEDKVGAFDPLCPAGRANFPYNELIACIVASFCVLSRLRGPQETGAQAQSAVALIL